MKTKTTYPERAVKVKMILIAVIISTQATLRAGDSSKVKQDVNYTNDASVIKTELPYTLNAGSTFNYLNDVAVEPEMEIEDWMCNVYKEYMNTCSNEDEIELEEWMYNTHDSFWLDLDDAEEPEMAIESWMTNPNDWMNTNDESMLTLK